MNILKYGIYPSIRMLAEDAHVFIQNGDIDQALKIIHDFLVRIISEPLCTSLVNGSKTLDELCLLIGKANQKSISSKIPEAKLRTNGKPVFVYIVTKLQKSGGHTRVIEDIIRARMDGQHIILSTELDGRSDIDYLLSGLAKQAEIGFETAPKENYQQRLTWLQKRLLEILPSRVYLFNHHQDSVAVSAIQPEMGLDAWYYHHGDHQLCLGVHLPHLKHVDPHPMGYHNCRDALGIENIYVPLTVVDKGCRPFDQPFMQNGYLTTCTIAKTNKIEKNYFISYLEVIPELLHATGGKHIHIGQLTPWARNRIKKTLKRYNVPLDRFVYIPWVSSAWKALIEHKVDLYLSSFPIAGALTLVEAMGAGIPSVIHKHISSRFLSCMDLAYTEAFCWRHTSELIEYCKNVSPDHLSSQSRPAREQYEKYHCYETFIAALDDEGVSVPPLRSEPFTTEADENACLIERNVCFSHVTFRALYRIGKRLRAKL